ncbi:MAG: Ig-like domain-containing protein, partial [Thermoanaerobaculia bacterium]
LSIEIEDRLETTTAAKLNDADFTFPGTVSEDGRYTLNVTVTDKLGQATTVAPIAFLVDQTKPVVSVTENGQPLESGTAFNRNVRPEITIQDLTETTVVALLNGQLYTFGTEITEEGPYTLTADVTDELGWTTSIPAITFYIDRTPPVVTLMEGEKELTDGLWFNRDVTPRAIIVDTTTTTTTATLNGEPYTMETAITAEGKYTLAVSVTDAVGLKTDVPPVTFTIDKTPPAITINYPAANASLSTPQVVVTGDSDDAMSVEVNGVEATIDTTEKKYVTPTAIELIEGENTIIAIGIDKAGNSTTITQLVNLDTRPPQLTIASPKPDACIGATEVQVTGRAPDAGLASVKVSAGGDPVDATIGADGRSFTATLPLPTEGKLVIRVEAIDSTGHNSIATVPVYVDRTKPGVEVLESGQPFSATLVNRIVALHVRAKDADPSATVAVTLDGQPYTNGTQLTADKTYELKAKATDCAGNVGDEVVLRFTIDRTPPQIVSINPANGATIANKPAIQGSLSEPASLVSETTGTVATVNGASFSLAAPLSEGLNTLSLLATDAAGNQSRTTYALTVDTIPPAVTITESGQTIEPNALFTRVVTPVVTVDDERATLTATLNGQPFTSGTNLEADGSYTLTARAKDVLGNESAPVTATFRIDRTGPSIKITSPADNTTVGTSSTAVTGTVSSDVVRVTVNGANATLSGTTFSITLPLELGPNVITAI